MSVTIPSHLSNDELMAVVARLAGNERVVTARLIAHLAEIDRRELYVPAGFTSLYIYCHESLGFSEDAAYNRKTAAQVARRFPVVLDMLADGRLSLTALRLLAPVLTGANHGEALSAATGRSRREVEEVVARLDPKPDVRSTVRKMPASGVAVPERDSAKPAIQRYLEVRRRARRRRLRRGRRSPRIARSSLRWRPSATGCSSQSGRQRRGS